MYTLSQLAENGVLYFNGKAVADTITTGHRPV